MAVSILFASLISIHQCAILSLGAPVGDFGNASLSITTKPVGNAWPTMTALNIEGHTEQVHNREFLVNVGLLSNTGANASSSPYRDKVAIYAVTRAVAGTGDVWA